MTNRIKLLTDHRAKGLLSDKIIKHSSDFNRKHSDSHFETTCAHIPYEVMEIHQF